MNDRIKKVMARALEVPEESLNVASNENNTENWDSIHVLQMIVLLEREFNIVIPEEKIGNIVSYNLIKDLVDTCLNEVN